MPYEFRLRTVRDYDHVPLGLGRTELELKLSCVLIALREAETRLGREHPSSVDFRKRAIGWAEKLGMTPQKAGIE